MDRTVAVQNLKRKRYLIGDEDRNTLFDDSKRDQSIKIRHQVYHLNSVVSPSLKLADLVSALTALHALSEYAKDGTVSAPLSRFCFNFGWIFSIYTICLACRGARG